MTGNLQAIGFLFTWVLGWGIGFSLIDAGLINAGVYSLERVSSAPLPPSAYGACSGAAAGSGSTAAGPSPSPQTVDAL